MADRVTLQDIADELGISRNLRQSIILGFLPMPLEIEF